MLEEELYLELISNPALTVGVLMTYECDAQRSKSFPVTNIYTYIIINEPHNVLFCNANIR